MTYLVIKTTCQIQIITCYDVYHIIFNPFHWETQVMNITKMLYLFIMKQC